MTSGSAPSRRTHASASEKEKKPTNASLAEREAMLFPRAPADQHAHEAASEAAHEVAAAGMMNMVWSEESAR